MFVALRDVHLAEAFASPREGLDALRLGALELHLAEDGSLLDLGGEGRRPAATPQAAEAYREHLRAHRVHACALLCEERVAAAGEAAATAALVRAVEVASLLEAPVLRVDPLLPDEPHTTFGAHLTRLTRVYREVLDATAHTSVVLAVENHGVRANRLTFLLALLRGVGHWRLGLTLDPANLYWSGLPLAEVRAVLAELAPHVRHTHCKNIGYPEGEREGARSVGWAYGEYACGLADGDLDYREVARLLARYAYAGAWCIENEALAKRTRPQQRAELLEADVAYLSECLAGIR